MFRSFWQEEAGFVVSAELILVATVAVLTLIVGLSELSYSVNQELEDVASAYGSANQSYAVSGVHGHFAAVGGSAFRDSSDFCDNDRSIGAHAPTAEAF